MRNVTVSIPDDVYRRARIWAAERDVSLSQVVAYVLDTLNGIRRAERHFRPAHGRDASPHRARRLPASPAPGRQNHRLEAPESKHGSVRL